MQAQRGWRRGVCCLPLPVALYALHLSTGTRSDNIYIYICRMRVGGSKESVMSDNVERVVRGATVRLVAGFGSCVGCARTSDHTDGPVHK